MPNRITIIADPKNVTRPGDNKGRSRKNKETDNTEELQNQKVANLQNNIEGIMDNIYRQTYYGNPTGEKDLRGLSDRINKSINSITDKNQMSIGMPNISKVYSRIIDSNRTKSAGGMAGDISQIFEGNSLLSDDIYSSFSQNYYLKEMDDEIDAVCKYMPKLEEAIETKKDNVLSADHFSKDFLTIHCDGVEDEALFDSRIESIKEKYNLLDIVEKAYYNASKYGEDFIYVVPYKKALARLLLNKDNTNVNPVGMNESSVDEFVDSSSTYTFNLESSGLYIFNDKERYTRDKNSFFVESASLNNDSKLHNDDSMLSKDESFSIKVEICTSNIIESVVKSIKKANDKLKSITENSLFFEAVAADKDTPFKRAMEKETDATGTLSFYGMKAPKKDKNQFGAAGSEGLFGSSLNNDIEKYGIKVNGCVVKRLEHTMVKPIYIDQICMGYYYIEMMGTQTPDTVGGSTNYGLTNSLSDPLTSGNANKTGALYNQVEASKQDEIVRYISGQLSQFIDKKFVNANQDLSKEIYMILKYNDIFNTPNLDRLKVTFIPPDEMIHVFFKQDDITKRGISDLYKALIPANIYCSLYLTNALQILTRGYDKRVYYVKQNVETNIARTLLNTIQQIKQGDFGIRHFRSINTILNQTGRFSDFIIPTNGSGDSPIQIETIPGQGVSLDDELLNRLEELAINATDVPIELIQARMSMDYATHYTMSSIKFLRIAYKRQGQYQPFLEQLIGKIYNCEYEENVRLSVTLPPPVFLNMTNSTQVMDNTISYVDKIIEMTNETDEDLRTMYRQDLIEYHLGTYIDTRRNAMILAKSKMKLKIQREGQE